MYEATGLSGRSVRRALTLALLFVRPRNGPGTPAHGDLHEQIAEVTRQIARRPDDARLYVKRGELHRFHGERDAALADYDRAARIDPTMAEVDLGRGKTLLEAGRPAPARAALERFLERRPDHAEGRLSLARALVRLRRPLEADAEYARAIRLVGQPKPDLYFERATALASSGRIDVLRIRVLDEGIERLGSLAALEELAVSLERRRGTWDGALARLDRISAGKARLGVVPRPTGRDPRGSGKAGGSAGVARRGKGIDRESARSSSSDAGDREAGARSEGLPRSPRGQEPEGEVRCERLRDCW